MAMKYSLFVILALVVFSTACNKDKFTTVPQAKISALTPADVHFGDIIRLKGSFTDDEGDIDSILIVYKWYNGSTALPRDTFRYAFEDLDLPASTRQGDLEINFEYHTNNTDYRSLPSVLKDTTAAFGLVIKDKALNRSEFVESKTIRLKNN